MDEAQEYAVQKMFSSLRKSMEPESVAAELYSEQILTSKQFDEIEREGLAKGVKNALILRYLREHGDKRVFPTFVKCIEEADPAMKYLADELRGWDA